MPDEPRILTDDFDLTKRPSGFAACCEGWRAQGFVKLETLFGAAAGLVEADRVEAGRVEAAAKHLCRAFNGSEASMAAISSAANAGQEAAAELAAWMQHHALDHMPYRSVSQSMMRALEDRLLADPEGYVEAAQSPYPFEIAGRRYGFDPQWVKGALARGRDRFETFCRGRTSEVAVLVGNGPSLKDTDLSLLRGQDVYISNYAIRHPELSRHARGVAVTNALVAEQEPYLFQLNGMWKFHPVWLRHALRETPETIWLNAVGGDLRFHECPAAGVISWHATVTYFWLQILFWAGYRKVLLIGVDNSYRQMAGLKEGDIIHQDQDDPNHFDASYFKGKIWQAADTGHMADTYALARQNYDADGREIVNCTVGGKLEAFRRSDLARELA